MKWVEVILPVPFNRSFTYSVPEKMEEECVFGRRVVVPFGRSEKTGFVVKETDSIEETCYEIRDVRRVVDRTAVFTRDLLETAEWMSQMYLSPTGVNLSSMIPSGRRESEYSPFNTISTFSRVEHLTEEQENALEKLRNGKKAIYYLFGITGSGKSEVYLRRAEDIIAGGKQVLYLVPEITLTHQLSGEVYSRFNGRVAVLHSALTPSQRLKEWLRIENGEVDIVIGARSSVFAPFSNLGLIIIDEEHEGAYKSGSAPRYHARQVAQYRAQKCGAELIMGSATPSLEAWRLMREQKLTAVVMRNRIGEGKFPRVNVVNMTGETRFISPTLESEIRSALERGRVSSSFSTEGGSRTAMSALPADMSSSARTAPFRSHTTRREKTRLPHMRLFHAPCEDMPGVQEPGSHALGLRHRDGRGGGETALSFEENREA